MEKRITPENITELKPNEVFVFGSNADGNHVRGAARIALDKFGAIMGQSYGLQGQSFGIDTMSGIRVIEDTVKLFTEFAKENTQLVFLVTKIGCGIAGFDPMQIAPFFKECQNLENVFLPSEFWFKKGYKVTDGNMKCRDFRFELNKPYIETYEPIPCNRGFHYCENISSCFDYYTFSTLNRVFEVIDKGDTQYDNDKSCTNHIELIRELSWLEVLEKCNKGEGNSGRNNAGNRNAGYYNAGNRNAGYYNAGNDNAGNDNAGNDNAGNYNAGNRNAGNYNAGNYNAGNRNAGNYNAGNRNAGNDNAGNRNAGYYNAGNRNAGYYNAGNRNAGYSNAGNDNAGNYNAGNDNAGYSNAGNDNAGYSNAGNRNAGNYNAGNRNAGYSNAGNDNAGNYNAGNRNAGYSNAGNDNAGIFNNLLYPKYVMFNKPSKWTYEDWKNSRAFDLLHSVDTTLWVSAENMSEEEKTKYGYFETTKGYVKHIPFKEAFVNAWHNWGKESRMAFTSLPNFDWEIFTDITGVVK